MEHHKVAVRSFRRNVLKFHPMGWRVDELRAVDESIWLRAPAPPSKPSNDGACRKSVCIIVRVIPDQLPNFRQLGSGNLSNSRVGQKSSQQIERTSIGHTLAPANTLAKEEHRPSALDAKAQPDR